MRTDSLAAVLALSLVAASMSPLFKIAVPQEVYRTAIRHYAAQLPTGRCKVVFGIIDSVHFDRYADELSERYDVVPMHGFHEDYCAYMTISRARKAGRQISLSGTVTTPGRGGSGWDSRLIFQQVSGGWVSEEHDGRKLVALDYEGFGKIFK